MKVYVLNGAGAPAEVTLNKTHFVAAGGEGSVYVKDKTAYKVYADKSKVIPAGKIKVLAGLPKRKNIVGPQYGLLDTNGNPIGYTMPAVPDSYSLCQIFPRVFRDRNNLTHTKVLKLVQGTAGTVEAIHQSNVLIVDLNEMNFLVDKSFDNVHFIDVDSYQTQQYPATALMESVRDRQVQNNRFSEGSDWFSFAVVSFQMFVGIHPYKGKHPKVKGMVKRMDANISVFDTDVRLPKVCYPLSVLPQVYADWYRAVLQDGKRVKPPSGTHAVATIAPVARMISSQKVNFIVKHIFPERILSVQGDTVVTDKSVSVKGRLYTRLPENSTTKVDVKGDFLVSMNSSGKLNASPLSVLTKLKGSDLAADQMTTSNGVVYIKTGDKVSRLVRVRKHLTAQCVVSVLPKAAKLYPGCVVQQLLGSWFVSLLENSCAPQHKLPELKNHRIIDAFYDKGVLIVIGTKSGTYDRFVYKFQGNKSTCRCVPNVTYTGINAAVLDTGVVVLMDESGDLEMFSANPKSSSVKVVSDPTLCPDVRLYSDGGSLGYFRGGEYGQLKLK